MKDVIKLLLLALSFLPLNVVADEVNEAEARRQAESFLKARGKQFTHESQLRLSAHGRRAKGVKSKATPAYYVFNLTDNQGFVIVSGDDCTEAILGYADEGTLIEDSMPDGLRYLLDGYAEQIAWLDSHPAAAPAASSARKVPARTAIAPLIETHWNQGAPYNNNCPEINNERTVTGCVATAMAQVMYYHRWPTGATTAIPAYTTTTKDQDKKTIKLEVDGLDATTFNWNDMTLTYSNTDTGDAADAVAELMQYCGSSIQMRYGLSANGGSSAHNVSIAEALKAFFGYDGSVTYVQRHHYSYADWVSLIYSELSDNRPVVLGGQATGGGHSFVCDGFDTNDYFHINWGWGGSSDGYFRLSVLQPWEQGIGGSSTLDGFSFIQDAVIGIRPFTSIVPIVCLSLEHLQFDETGSSSTLTVNRTSTDEAFSGINIYYSVCSFLRGTNTFDYAVQLTQADGTVIATFDESDEASMNFATQYNYTLSGITTPAALTDGTYYIKVVSRAADATEWQECYDGPQQQMTAIVSGNTMTITAPIVYGTGNLPTTATIEVTGDSEAEGYLTQGYEQQVTVRITGSDADYHSNIILCVNGQAVMGKTLDIPAGQTVEAHYSFIPTTAGGITLTLEDRNENGRTTRQIGSPTIVTITESDAANTQEITVTPIITNLNGNKLYGNALRVTATVSNPSATNSFASRLNCSLRTYENAEAAINAYINATVQHQNITIAKSGTTDVTFEYTGLELGRFYCLRFTYTQSYEDEGETKTRTQEALITDRYEMGEGYLVYNANGTSTILPTATTIDGGDALCLDLTSLSTIPDVTPSSNPNCIYLLNSDAEVPSALSEKNVVKGSTAATLTLTDGYDFHTPVTFTATNVSYTRTFTLAAAGTSGWNTIMLPFTVNSITCDGLGTVNWFHSSSDTGKNFWVKTFTGDAAGHVYFDFADEMAANTPYIIAVPDDRWGAAWQMTHKNVTFSGTDATIQPITTGIISGNNYRFCGSTIATTRTDGYALNDVGSNFARITADTDIPAFRAWIEATSISSLTMPALSIMSGSPVDGINPLDNLTIDNLQSVNGKWFDLSGRSVQRPQKPGLYIVGSKKYIVK